MTFVQTHRAVGCDGACFVWSGLLVFLTVSTSYAEPQKLIQFRKVAETGMVAPGTEPGVVFGALANSPDHSVLIPKMDAAGRVAFMGFLAGSDVDDSNFQGMWAEQDDALQLVVRNGQPAPGAGQDVLFRGVPALAVPSAPEGSGTHIAFHAELTGPGVDLTNDEGIWKGGPESLSLVAREGGTPPALPGLMFGTLGIFANGAGHVLMRSTLLGPGVDDSNREALFSDRNGPLELLLREGDAAPSTEPGTVFGGSVPWQSVLFNDNSDVAFIATLTGPAIDGFNDQALYSERGGILQLVAREGQPAPGQGNGVTLGGNSSELALGPVAFNNHGRVAFLVDLGGTQPTHHALFSDRTGTLSAVAVGGQPAPGTNFDYSLFGKPTLNELNQIAFSAAFPDHNGDIFTPPAFGVFSDVDGAMALVVAPGDVTAEGEIVKDATVTGFNSAGQMLLNIQTDSTPSRIGFWLRDTEGSLLLIAASGDQFDLRGDGSDVREVVRVVSGGMNEAGQVALRLDFADGSSAHVVATPPCQLSTRLDLCAAFVSRLGDADRDGDVDLRDFWRSQNCFGAATTQQCVCVFDFNLDCEVDLSDFKGFARQLAGPR